jgi:hypothetical protein
MAVHSSYYLPVVDVPLQRLLEQSPDVRAYRKWLSLLPVFIISAIVVGLVLWGVFVAADFALSAAADTRANL